MFHGQVEAVYCVPVTPALPAPLCRGAAEAGQLCSLGRDARCTGIAAPTAPRALRLQTCSRLLLSLCPWNTGPAGAGGAAAAAGASLCWAGC